MGSETRVSGLFVYGTLQSAARTRLGSVERRRLTTHGRVVGPARVPGVLYDLGAYPGLVPATGHEPAGFAAWVCGELLELAQPDRVFTWLDPYEGIVPHLKTPPYRRELRCVTTAYGERNAWVYTYTGPLTGARPIRSGRWIA